MPIRNRPFFGILFLWSTVSGCHYISWGVDAYFYFLLHLSDCFVGVFSPNIISVIKIVEYSMISVSGFFWRHPGQCETPWSLAVMGFGLCDSDQKTIESNQFEKQLSLIKSVIVSRIQSEKVASTELRMLMIALAADTWCDNGLDLDASVQWLRWLWHWRRIIGLLT